ncbi:LysE family transporter [Algibacter sp. L4_22]|uniref:LysE family transporter n=1 Tax=Algibacter sp. L4_22 TaxID=2942477 RepID=UPI00201B6FFC|nr:LysE family transporter [Algibacter sp. L4_22]MCL5129775.1 LysE family transporter [Algibacter sp. L4_22]
MNLLIYFLIGFTAAVIGALPLGTTNVAVINTTIKENVQNALKIIYTAALAELILIVFAIIFNSQIEVFIKMNIWLQYTIVVILLVVGVVLLSGRTECVKDENDECIIIKKRRTPISKEMLGFFLGLVNPTVLIYWIFIMSYLNKNIIDLNIAVEYQLVLLFLIGAYFGKLLILYGYGKFSDVLKVRVKNLTTRINRVIGVLLVCISIFQITKLIYL